MGQNEWYLPNIFEGVSSGADFPNHYLLNSINNKLQKYFETMYDGMNDGTIVT